MPRGAIPLARLRGATAFKRKPQPISLNIGSTSATSLRSNRFSKLSTEEDMDDTPEYNTNLTLEKSKPPPIVADSIISLREIQHLLGNDCVYKRTSIGTKIFPQDQEKYDSCIKTLRDNEIQFHTFNSKENKLYTAFIYGLPKMDTNDILKDLNNYNLSPKSVVEVKTKYSSLDDAVYKVMFPRKTFTPNSLHNVKTICNVVITWKKNKPRKANNPTQCWNCLMFGHGGEHCNRLPACMTCAGTHTTASCPFTQNNKKPAVFSCFNCKKHGKERSDHSANDLKCPLRAEYLEIRSRVTSSPTKRSTTRRQQSSNFTPPTINMPINSQRSSRSYADIARGETSDLFSIDEIFGIFTSALDELSRCTTKVQQIQVVMSLLRYAHDIK